VRWAWEVSKEGCRVGKKNRDRDRDRDSQIEVEGFGLAANLGVEMWLLGDGRLGDGRWRWGDGDMHLAADGLAADAAG